MPSRVYCMMLLAWWMWCSALLAEPATVPQPLAQWWADQRVQTDAQGGVIRWIGNDADQAEPDSTWQQDTPQLRPRLIHLQDQGYSVVRFDGQDQRLELPQPIDLAGKSVFMVVRWQEPRPYSYALGLDAGTNGYLRLSNAQQLMIGGPYPVLYHNLLRIEQTRREQDPRNWFYSTRDPLTRMSVIAITDNPPPEGRLKWMGWNQHNNQSGHTFCGDVAALLIFAEKLDDAQRRAWELQLTQRFLNRPKLRTLAIDVIQSDELFELVPGNPDGVIAHAWSPPIQSLARHALDFELQGAHHPGDKLVVYINGQSFEVAGPAPLQPANRRIVFTIAQADEAEPLYVEWRRMRADRAPLEAATLTVHRAGITKLSPLVIHSLLPDKVRYRPGEQVRLQAVLENTSKSELPISLRLFDVTGVNDRRQVADDGLTLAPGERREQPFSFTLDDWEYGHDLLLEVEHQGQVISTASRPVAVANNLWQVAIGGTPNGPIANSAKYTREQIVAQIEGFVDQYVNCWEKYFWAPDDWGQMTVPQDAVWFSGQARRHEKTQHIQLQIETSHRLGISVLTYGKCMAGGPEGWELARRKPQWFVTDDLGRTFGRDGDVWDFDHWHLTDQVNPRDFKYVWSYRWPDLRRLDALDHGIDQLIASTAQFKWDGVRYDSGGFRAHYIDGKFNGHDPLNTRNMRRTKERLWEKHPDYLFGYNTDNTAARDGRAYPLTLAEMSHEMREMLAGGGLWMGEAIKHFQNGSVQYQTWSQMAQDEARCIQAVWQAGGHFCYLYSMAGAVRNAYQLAIGSMIGAHPYGGEHVGVAGSENWGRFLTRWSGLFWDHTLRPLDDSDHIEVDAPTALWWQPFARQRVVSSQRRQVVVHLLNPPPSDQINDPQAQFPPPVEQATLAFTPPQSQKLVEVSFIAPGYPDRVESLAISWKQGKAVMQVPRVDLWAMVVLELEGTFELPAQAERFASPLTEAELAEIKRTALPEVNDPPWWGLRPPAPTPNLAVADDVHNPSPQASAHLFKHDFGTLTSSTIPEGLTVGGASGLDVLLIKGHYWRFHRVVEALQQQAPQARLRSCTVRDLPMDHAAVFAHDVIVLANVPAYAWDANGLQRLVDFVHAGGRLVILGGPFTLGQSLFSQSRLDVVLPVELRTHRDLFQLPEPRAMGLEPQTAASNQPLLYYYHAVQPRPNAVARAWAGDLPVFWEGRFGQGSTAVFVGAPLGEANSADQIPYWESTQWPTLLGSILLKQPHE